MTTHRHATALHARLFLTGLLLASNASAAQAADIGVTAQGVTPGPGSIRFVLYRGPDGFRHEDHAYRVLSAPAQKATVSVRFEAVPPGRYAVMAYHDANDNKKLDLRFGMFPKEGWGLSNNPKVMGPPSFDASAFVVTDPGTQSAIEMHY